ncbi:MAG: hypothetical protein WCK62_05430 [Actinomycetes bacterium]|jgi:hypothetical protein
MGTIGAKRLALGSVVTALLIGSSFATYASATENPPAPLKFASLNSSSLSVFQADNNASQNLQAWLASPTGEMTTVKIKLPAANHDHAIRIEHLSRTSLPGGKAELVTLLLTGIDMNTLQKISLGNLNSLQFGRQNIAISNRGTTRGVRWSNLNSFNTSNLPVGVTNGYRLMSDGSVLIQYKQSKTLALAEPILQNWFNPPTIS